MLSTTSSNLNELTEGLTTTPENNINDHQMVWMIGGVVILQLKPPAVSIDSWKNFTREREICQTIWPQQRPTPTRPEASSSMWLQKRNLQLNSRRIVCRKSERVACFMLATRWEQVQVGFRATSSSIEWIISGQKEAGASRRRSQMLERKRLICLG